MKQHEVEALMAMADGWEARGSKSIHRGQYGPCMAWKMAAKALRSEVDQFVIESATNTEE